MSNKERGKTHKSTSDIAEELGIIPIGPEQLKRQLFLCAKAGKVALVLSRPGVGKTTLAEQAIAALHKKLHVVRLNGHEPMDFGLPYFTEDRAGRKRHDWSLPNFYQAFDDTLEEGYPGGWGFFFDEAPQALPAMMNRIGEMLNERQLNRVAMHDKVSIILAGNFAQDKAATYPIPRQILNRCVVYVLAPDINDFLQYCSENDVRSEISGFAKLFPESLDSYDPDAMTNCTPRSLVSLSRVLDARPNVEDEHAIYSGTIGKGYGAQFVGWMRTYRDLPKLEDIINNPSKHPLPADDQTDIMCALSSMLSRALDAKNAEPVVTFLKRMSSEFCVYAMREAASRNSKLKETQAFIKWATQHGGILR